MPATTASPPFHCIPCNMDFPTATHQEIHNRTKYHQARQDAHMRLNTGLVALFNEDPQ